jgi:hypothetical protein
MADMTYVAFPSGIRDLMRSEPMRRAMEQAAQRGKAYAESIAPRDSGEYATSFVVTSGIGKSRAFAVLANTAPHAVVVELVNGGGQRVLGRTVDVIEKGG